MLLVGIAGEEEEVGPLDEPVLVVVVVVSVDFFCLQVVLAWGQHQILAGRIDEPVE